MKFNLFVNPRLQWIAALEGLRGVAVIAVMLVHFHATRNWFPGGVLGVDVFFVLSGFLITTILLQEHAAQGGISLRRFYSRRARRLLPAVFAFLAVYAAIAILFNDHRFTGEPTLRLIMRTCVSTVLYFFNVLKMGDTLVGPGTHHLWSLSVEEQFYLVWPLLLVAGLKMRLAPTVLFGCTVMLVVASAALPAITQGSHNRFYFGPDFRAHELLIGALLAQLYVGGIVHRGLATNRLFLAAAACSGGLLLYWLVGLQDRFTFLFQGGYTLVALCSVLVVCYAAVANPPLLNSRVLCYVGRRSYALYLWHMPIGYWLREWEVVPQLVTAFALSFLAAELSYQVVERPFLAGHRPTPKATPEREPSSQPSGEERLAA